MQIPTREQARALLAQAGQKNPGPWTAHSENAGRAAFYIARRCPGMDADAAYILGMLHDIGRRFGVTGDRHMPDGWRFCMERGWTDLARICLTHAFPLQDIRCCAGQWDTGGVDGTQARRTAERELPKAVYDDYDRLIQLCDSLAVPGGFCLMEKRWVDVAFRYGVNDHTVRKWRKLCALQRAFEQRMGCGIYDVLPGVKETTFQPL